MAPIAEQLGTKGSLPIGAEVVDNCFTGNTYGTLTYQQGKVIRPQQWLAQQLTLKFGQSYGYSDSINDQPVTQYVDSATMINPSKELGAEAAEHGWQVCRSQR